MAAAAALSLTLLALTARTGDPQFTLKGTVVDPSRAPVRGATVSAQREAGGEGPSARTGEDGSFVLALRPGSYTVSVAAPGFAQATQAITALEQGSESREFTLELARFRETLRIESQGSYGIDDVTAATRTPTPLRDVPQSVTVTTRQLIQDQLMLSMGDVMRYTPGIQSHQGENNRDQAVIRGNSSSADFFADGVRDDVQYYRDLYNVERVEALKGPNATMFGRGGGGGVLNRVMKVAEFQPLREATLQVGDYGHKRAAVDLDQPVNKTVAIRVNAVYEDSDSFRSAVGLERYGINPTVTIAATARTRVVLGYEHLHDRRVADRGITSFQGRPADVDIDTYYGNPADSHVRADVDLASALVEHTAGSLTLRNRTLFGAYDRGYRNYVPGAVSADKTQVSLSAYNNATQRDNLFNQTDLVWKASTGKVAHTVLGGVELGRQLTDNFRNTGYFDGTALTLLVPYENPTISSPPVDFRQSATDADNHLKTLVGAAYAQDQASVTKWLQLVAGLRFDRFDLTYHNNRNGDTLSRVDDLVSPRAGVIVKPIAPVSLYGSYTVSWLPSSGDQFSSITAVNQQLEPEKFTNYEAGLKWEPRGGLALTAAVYRLDRTNTRSTDPNDPTRIVQTGSQRTNGVEIGVTGRATNRWQLAGGYAYQDAFVTSATAAAREGAVVGQVPHHTFSLWNDWQLTARVGTAIGVLYRSEMFATIDNSVTLPGYTRVDCAVHVALARGVRAQVNLENVFDHKYWLNADSNTNLSPGAPRTFRVALAAGF
jgi:catecholate siderophore receptor